jgi:hypothetical protein
MEIKDSLPDRFKDCIKTGDGIRAKKSEEGTQPDWGGRRPSRKY